MEPQPKRCIIIKKKECYVEGLIVVGKFHYAELFGRMEVEIKISEEKKTLIGKMHQQ